VYTLLLRPVKKQLLTILRELPLRPASKPAIAEAATAQVTSASQQEALEEILGAAGQDGDVSLKKLAILKNHLVEGEDRTGRRLAAGPELATRGRCRMNTPAPAMTARSGLRKAAVLLVLLGEEAATSIYRNLSQAQVQRLTREIAELNGVKP